MGRLLSGPSPSRRLWRELAGESVALGRMGTANDLAAAVPALLSAEFGWATGSLIETNGGQGL